VIPRAAYDVETRSECDISRGLDVYTSHHTTQLVCAAIETPTWRAAATFLPSTEGRDTLEKGMREKGLNVVPPESLLAMLQATQTVVAHNFAFDQVATERLAGVRVPPDRWSCTMSRARRHGLPASLGNLCSVLRFGDAGKDAEGSRLMKQVSKPRPTWARKGTGPQWFEDAGRLARLAVYCAQDVSATRRVDETIPELEPAERAIWLHVNDMNLVGIPVDVEMIRGAVAMSDDAIRDVTDRIRHYTGGLVQSLKAPGQIVAWAERYGYPLASIAKDELAAAIADPAMPEPVRVVALARQEAGRGSVAKFETAADFVSPDGRLRYQVEYAGTSTLRLAGRGVQPLNLPRPKIEADKSAALADIKAGRPIRCAEWKLRYDPERALDAIRRGDLANLRGLGDPEEILSNNIRQMIVAPAGKKIVSPDLSAIEARGVFWVSDCHKALHTIRESDAGRGPDIYCVFASEMVGYPVDKKQHPEIRQNQGKVPVLSCGYGAGAAKVALKNNIPEDVAQIGVSGYRRVYSEVPDTWRDLEGAAINAILHPGYETTACRGRVRFVYEGGWLRMLRPSGTWMYLPDAGIDDDGRLFYHAWIKGAWRPESVWGGVLINFVVQGMCRELIYESEMRLAQDPRFELFLQCYDSLSALVDEAEADALCSVMLAEMTRPPLWAPDFPLAAEGKPKDRYS